jgi:hypothetical protein
MRLPNQGPSGTGAYTDDATIPGTGLYDGDYEFRDAADEDEYSDEGLEDDGDDLYGPGDLGDDDLYEEGEDEEPDILESPAYRGEELQDAIR